MKEGEGRKEQKMRREEQQRKSNGGEGEEWRGGEEKRQRNKWCPPENWHAEGQHLLRIMGPTLEERARAHMHGHEHTHTQARMLTHTVHVPMKLNTFQGLLYVFVNKVLSNMINPPGYHELQN